MAGIGFGLDVEGLNKLNEALSRLIQGVDNKSDLFSTLGAMVEDQTKARIEDEQANPDGKSWPAWSPNYAKTRHDNHDLLQNEGHLFDSIQSLYSDEHAEIGTNLLYAATHQYGNPKQGIPQRAFVGLSDDNLHNLEKILDNWANRLI